MNKEETTIFNKPFVFTKRFSNTIFENQYIQLRNKELRIFTDEELKNLPAVNKSHPHFSEWIIRKKSATVLLKYLNKKNKSLSILEVGCGNGWLSKMLASITKCNVTGIDINKTELEQATRNFDTISNLKFIYGDIHSATFDSKKFDCIIFAASIQYFPSLSALIARLSELMHNNGEIHIIDSPFYKPLELAAAKERSTSHFTQTGFPEMTDYYFHHSWHDLATYNHKTLYKPSLFQKYILQNNNPFPWICITKP